MPLNVNGDRIREARLFNKMTITKLADELGISKQMVSRYEHGKANISLEKFRKMVKILNFPTAFFTGHRKFEYENFGTFYRSRLTATQSEKQPSELYKEAAAVLRDYFEQYIQFPSLDIMDVENIDNPEEAARMLRAEWGLGLGAIHNIVEVMEAHGLTVINIDFQSDKIDARSGYTEINGHKYYVVLTDMGRSNFYREQFTLAHELGHYILHGDKLEPQDLSIEEYRAIEKEANLFASAFLLPDETFSADIRSIKRDNLLDYLPLKTTWNVSVAAMIMRARALGLVDSAQYEKLQKAISYRGWRKEEELDELKATPPHLMHDAFRLMEEHTSLKPSTLASVIDNNYGYNYPNEVLATILGLPLKEFSSEVVPLTLKTKGI